MRRLALAVLLTCAFTVGPATAAHAHECAHSDHWDGVVHVDYQGGYTDSSGRHRHKEYRWYPPFWATTSRPICSAH